MKCPCDRQECDYAYCHDTECARITLKREEAEFAAPPEPNYGPIGEGIAWAAFWIGAGYFLAAMAEKL